jgi:hypothetical protein
MCAIFYDIKPWPYPDLPKQFIAVATEQGRATVGHKLESYTSEVRAVRYVRPGDPSGARFVIVDTPGFDDTNKSDTEILTLIAQWLQTTCVTISLVVD